MQDIIDLAWESKNLLAPENAILLEDARAEVNTLLEGIDKGKIKIADKEGGIWVVNQKAKKAILLYFRLMQNALIEACDLRFYDKVPLKFAGFSLDDFKAHGVRVVPGAIVRKYAYIANGVVLMPSFVNIGAYVGEGTMVDTWATIGSCAQVGKNCHISGGVGLGGVLEPISANPVIIEDNVFIGARSEIVEGVIVEEGAVLSMGVFIGASTKIYDRETGEITYGRIPAYSVVVPGTLPSSDGKTHLQAAIIIKKVDEKTRSKTSINTLLRE